MSSNSRTLSVLKGEMREEGEILFSLHQVVDWQQLQIVDCTASVYMLSLLVSSFSLVSPLLEFAI
jgi:hypothetical protein